jgi:hypothetical protein
VSVEFGEFDHTVALSSQRGLFEDAFPENVGLHASSVEHYLWKFHGAPFVPAAYEYAAVEGAKMLGYYAAIPYPYRLGDRTILAGMVCDVMTHSEARGKGLFTELGGFALNQMAATDLGFVTGYPVRPEVMGGHLRVGWKIAFELPMYLRPLRANAVLRTRGLARLAPAANLGISAQRWLLSPRRTAAGYRTRVGAPDDLLNSPAFEAFSASWAASIKNHLVKSPEFYAWRLGAPGVEYRVFLVYRGDVVIAAAIGREARLHGIPSFALMDLMAIEKSTAALGALYSEIEHEARRRQAEAIVVMMSKYQARAHRLARFGFLRSPFTFKLIVRSVDDTIDTEQIAREEDWHLLWIDSDDL